MSGHATADAPVVEAALAASVQALHAAVGRHRRPPRAAVDRLVTALERATMAYEDECAQFQTTGDTSACASDEATERPVTLESLPIEVLTRLVAYAASGRGVRGSRAACHVVATMATVSKIVRLGAERCWPELALGLFPPTHLPPPPRPPWMSFDPPSDWRASLASLTTTLKRGRPEWSFFHPGSSGGSRSFLPRKLFAHTTCVYDGKLYVFGGRHLLSHSMSLDVLDLSCRPLAWRRVRARSTTLTLEPEEPTTPHAQA